MTLRSQAVRKFVPTGVFTVFVASLFAFPCVLKSEVLQQNLQRKAERIPVVVQGKGEARLVIPADAGKSLKDGARLLAETIAKSTGVQLDVITETVPEDGLIAIHFGATAYVKGLGVDITNLDPDGYVFVFPDMRHIVLLGAGVTGQEYAAYEFLERYLGVRWLFPGAAGEHVPAHTDLTIPSDPVRSEPCFQHRMFSGLEWRPGGQDCDVKPARAGEATAWANCNRMRSRLSFHHNLWRLFPPEQYGDTHPEFFPLLKGERFVPKLSPGKKDVSVQIRWQPCFTAPGIAEEAVKNICAFFEKTPQATSYSFGVNDSGGHCECPACMAIDGGRLNALGMRDASPGYYAWCNAVARGVCARFPDKHFGLLAYSGVYSPPPGIRLDQRVVPFITYDRMKWVDEETRKKGYATNAAWEKAAPVLGWYDYIYGGRFYLAPRVYFHAMADYLRYGYRHNVRHYYAEAYPSGDWHEGPKLYVLLKLLWEPDQDVDKLLNDWYTCAVGATAAPYLAQYFEFWELFWTQRVKHTVWFKERIRGQYLDFKSSGYASALTHKDLQHCEELLTQALASAGTDVERTRAALFLNGFMARKGELKAEIPLPILENTRVLATLVSSGFDTDMDGWKTWQRDYAKATFKHDPAIGRTKPGALKVEATGSQATPLAILRQIPVSHGKTYRATVWVRAELVEADTIIHLRIDWKDAKGRTRSTMSPMLWQQALPDIWQKLTVHFTVGAGEQWDAVRHVSPILTIRYTDQGVVWFDDFLFEEIGK